MHREDSRMRSATVHTRRAQSKQNNVCCALARSWARGRVCHGGHGDVRREASGTRIDGGDARSASRATRPNETTCYMALVPCSAWPVPLDRRKALQRAERQRPSTL